jgi:nitroimidazol reductase NimA-like FMN-containing flavoprotein (pyridoxamine 5'-phosphate oxidase superfamily)
MVTGPPPVIHELTASESWQLLRQAVVGRLAVVVDGAPDIFPVNHIVDAGSLVFRTGEGTKLWGALGQLVAFEVDGLDAGSAVAWSVVVRGRATEVKQLHDVVQALELPLYPWQGGDKPRFVRIEPDAVTGRRFVANIAPAAAP